MNIKEWINFIKENTDEDDFTGGVIEDKVKLIEIALNVSLPLDYKCFLENFGMGGPFGVEILGFGKVPPATVVSETERFRKMGLPLEFVVIESPGEHMYCLDTAKKNHGICPIICWDRTRKSSYQEANSFIEFTVERFLQSKELFEEED